MDERLLTVPDLVSLTNWAPITIYRKGANGEIPGKVKLGKRSIRFRESEVREWLKESADASATQAVNE